MKFQISNDDSVPAGGKCGKTHASTDGCWDSFATSLTLTNQWQKYELKFGDLSQDGWGRPAPSGSFDATTARVINFLVSGPSTATAGAVTADFWIDDVCFE